MPKIVLAMSGGVDSSVAAELLLREGHQVVGLFMRHECSGPRDEADARSVAEKLGIPLHVVSFRDDFQEIVEYFVTEYTSGRTPNPCAVCNAKIKFRKFIDFADSVGAEFVATGHYARILSKEPEMECSAISGSDGSVFRHLSRSADCAALHPRLFKSVDATKDQSYVLFGIRREILPRLIFPLGNFLKSEIRQIAEEIGLPVARKKDSQEICFVPEKDHAKFVREYLAHRGTSDEIQKPAAEFVMTDGKVVGRHEGIEKYTVGQRKGLGLAFGEPRYVVRLERETNRVVLGTYAELAREWLEAAGANWLIPPPQEIFSCEVKIRYRTPAVPATVTPGENGAFRVDFAAPVHGVAPGQAVVCYDGERVLGGGWIQ